jgi:uncharacterized protein (DUF1501 family)
MLTLEFSGSRPNCDGLARRDFIRCGGLGFAGLTLPWLLANRAAVAAEAEVSRNKAVVFIFLGGGASHIETFNPNMHAPAPYCSLTGEVQTTLPGVTFGGTFPGLAQRAERMAVVRSFRHPIADHDKAISHVLTGGTDATGAAQNGFSLGACASRIRGGSHPTTGMPAYALVSAPEIDPQYRRELERVLRGSRSGSLGPACAPFLVDAAEAGNSREKSGTSGKSRAPSLADDMRLSISRERLDDRRELLRSLDGMRRQFDETQQFAGVDKYTQQAFDLILGSASQAFDLSRESPQTLERYDTSRFREGKKTFRPSSIGRQLLIARRMLEAGCSFITVQSAGWDMHADGNNPGVVAGMEMLGRPLDQALSAFLDDLAERGLSEKVLVVVTGDFGRTPNINKNGGRDHWANLCTLAFAGGGLRMGQVIGRSGPKNDVPASEPYSTQHLTATILHTLFDISALRVVRGLPRDILKLVENGEPIAELFG